MPLNIDVMRSLRFDPVVTTIDPRDAMLHAVSIGIGREPLSAFDLRHCYERDLEVFPTLVLTLPSSSRDWLRNPETGVSWTKVVHGGDDLRVHAPIMAGQRIRAETIVGPIFDKGEKGAIVQLDKYYTDADDGRLIAQARTLIFCRADGGFGGEPGPVPTVALPPDRVPDRTLDVALYPEAALLYRLNGDYTAFHADPEIAATAGFPRPIMHGLGAFGHVAGAIMRLWPDRRLGRLAGRFSAVSFPGETLSISLWEDEDGLAFRVDARDRGVSPIDRGRIAFR